MIYVSQDQLDQVEYLIGQSIQGNHILFDTDTVRQVFTKTSQGRSIDESEGYAMEHHIERIIQLPTLAQKRAYLERLDHYTLELVVRTYFNIVENNLYENTRIVH